MRSAIHYRQKPRIGVALAVLAASVIACGGDHSGDGAADSDATCTNTLDRPTLIMKVAEGEPPENLKRLGIGVVVQACGGGALTLDLVEGEMRVPPNPLRSTSSCLPAGMMHYLQVFPSSRSGRLTAQLWQEDVSVATEDDEAVLRSATPAIPRYDCSDVETLVLSRSIVVPPDESLPDDETGDSRSDTDTATVENRETGR